MKEKRKPLIKKIFILSIVTSIGSFYCFTVWLNYLFWFEGYFENNQILDRYVAEFHNRSHPPQTSSVASYHGVHRPPGNGNNCFFFVAQVRQFSGNRDRIQQFYLDRGRQIEFLEGNRFGKENKPFDSPIPYGYHHYPCGN